MNAIFRELKSFPGMVLGTTLALIITFWALNTVRTNRYVPTFIQNGAGWAESRASGQYYGY